MIIIGVECIYIYYIYCYTVTTKYVSVILISYKIHGYDNLKNSIM